MHSAELRVGRLIETRVRSLDSVADVEALSHRFRELTISRRSVVICGDYRNLNVFAPHVAERFALMLTGANLIVERSAILCSPDRATALLQLERMVHLAANSARRTFRDSHELARWLSEILTQEEQQRLSEFLKEE